MLHLNISTEDIEDTFTVYMVRDIKKRGILKLRCSSGRVLRERKQTQVHFLKNRFPQAGPKLQPSTRMFGLQNDFAAPAAI